MHFEPTLRGGCGRAWNARPEGSALIREQERAKGPRRGKSRKTLLSLRIGHSAQAAELHRNLSLSTNRLAVSMQRLSSGLRINSAADDAAGLGISEKMRSQIRSLDQA